MNKPIDKDSIFVTSELIRDDGVVCPHDAADKIGRPNGYDYIHGVAEHFMQEQGGYDMPCFYNNCPTVDGIYDVTIMYKGRTAKGTYFLWTGGGRKHGLIVEDTDSPSFEYYILDLLLI